MGLEPLGAAAHRLAHPAFPETSPPGGAPRNYAGEVDAAGARQRPRAPLATATSSWQRDKDPRGLPRHAVHHLPPLPLPFACPAHARAATGARRRRPHALRPPRPPPPCLAPAKSPPPSIPVVNRLRGSSCTPESSPGTTTAAAPPFESPSTPVSPEPTAYTATTAVSSTTPPSCSPSPSHLTAVASTAVLRRGHGLVFPPPV